HIGYRGWQQPAKDVMPKVVEISNSNIQDPERSQSSTSQESTQDRSAGRPGPQQVPTQQPAPGKPNDPLATLAAAGRDGPRSAGQVFVEENGYVSIEADHFSRKTEAAGARWERIEDLGRTGSSMGIFPLTAKSLVPPDKGACLEYEISLTCTGAVEVTSIL